MSSLTQKPTAAGLMKHTIPLATALLLMPLSGLGALKFTGEINSDIADGAIKPNAPAAQLYDLEADRSQSHNIIREHPEQAALMDKHLAELQRQPSAKQSNEAPMECRKIRKRTEQE